jgi:hypothetical protein
MHNTQLPSMMCLLHNPLNFQGHAVPACTTINFQGHAVPDCTTQLPQPHMQGIKATPSQEGLD